MFSMVLESRTLYNDASEHFSPFVLFVVIFSFFFTADPPSFKELVQDYWTKLSQTREV